MSVKLELLYEGQPILVDKADVIVGRTRACTVRVVHPLVSRQHCKIRVTRDALLVEDMGSSNGTFVNGDKIDRPYSVQVGDEVSLGREGAVLEIVSARFDGEVVGEDPEEDRMTMLPGDPRAQKVMAQIDIAHDAIPQLGEAEVIGDSFFDAAADEPMQLEPLDDELGVDELQADLAGLPTATTPQERTQPAAPTQRAAPDKTVPVRPAPARSAQGNAAPEKTVPVRPAPARTAPARPAAAPDKTMPVARAASAPAPAGPAKTMPIAPATPAEPPAPAAAAEEATRIGSAAQAKGKGLGIGLAVGIVVGLAAIAGLAFAMGWIGGG